MVKMNLLSMTNQLLQRQRTYFAEWDFHEETLAWCVAYLRTLPFFVS